MTRALTHGLYARTPSALEIRGRKVARLMRRLRVVAPWLEPSDESTARAYCELEILSAAIFAQLCVNGVTRVSADGHDLAVRNLVDAHRQMKQTQLAYARELGLTPAARQALRASSKSTIDLAQAFAAEDVSVAVTDKVVDVAKSRGKIVHENSDDGGGGEDGNDGTKSEPTGRSEDKPAGV